MHADEFYRWRKADWEKLTGLLDRCQNGEGRLSPDQVHELGQLYRQATSDLALAQRDFPENRVTVYLNQLVARAHAIVYRSEPMALRRIWNFITTGYPRAYRQVWPFMLASFLLLLLPALAAGFSTAYNPQAARWLLPAEVQQLIPMIQRGDLWTNIPINERPYASSFIMQNNIRVSFMVFGFGVLAGVYTAWMLIFNGLLLGGLLGLTAHYGIGFDLATFVIGHGVVELSVIFIAGGAGLTLGWAMIHPGLLSRRDALVQAAQHAVRLVSGCVPLLMFAGTIEGFISPAENIPWPVKWGIGILSGLALHGYLLLAGREKKTG